MNPLDNEEYKEFLTIVDRDMPLNSGISFKVKCQETILPKNLKEYSLRINDKFLNNNQHIIEEIQYRDKSHNLPKWIKQYQLRYFGANLLGDGFFKVNEFGDFGNTRYANGMLGGEYISFGYVNGATLEVGSDTSNSGAQDNLLSCVTITGGVVGTYYNQVAFSVITAAGNYKVGIYDDSSGPHNILSQSSSVAVPSGYTYTSIPEVALTTSTIYLALNSDSSSAHYYFVAAGATARYSGATTYGAFVNNPAGVSAGTAQFHCKTGHS